MKKPTLAEGVLPEHTAHTGFVRYSTLNKRSVESKNGSVIRKLFGYAHIPQRWAPLINVFNHTTLFPYINYHRPLLFPHSGGGCALRT